MVSEMLIAQQLCPIFQRPEIAKIVSDWVHACGKKKKKKIGLRKQECRYKLHIQVPKAQYGVCVHLFLSPSSFA